MPLPTMSNLKAGAWLRTGVVHHAGLVRCCCGRHVARVQAAGLVRVHLHSVNNNSHRTGGHRGSLMSQPVLQACQPRLAPQHRLSSSCV